MNETEELLNLIQDKDRVTREAWTDFDYRDTLVNTAVMILPEDTLDKRRNMEHDITAVGFNYYTVYAVRTDQVSIGKLVYVIMGIGRNQAFDLGGSNGVKSVLLNQRGLGNSYLFPLDPTRKDYDLRSGEITQRIFLGYCGNVMECQVFLRRAMFTGNSHFVLWHERFLKQIIKDTKVNV